MTARKETESHASTSDRLLAGAAELFRRKGYAATTTRELSALLGIQNASLYYHMDSKEDLLYRMSLATVAEVKRVIESCLAERSDPLERLDLIVRRYTTSTLRDRDRFATTLIDLRALSAKRRDEITVLHDDSVALVRKTVAAAQKAGEVRTDIHAKYLTRFLFNLLNWSIFWYRPEGELSAEQIAEMMSTVYLNGIVTDAARAKADSFKRAPRRAAVSAPKRKATRAR